MGRYQLRYAAGCHRLLDMEQEDEPYKSPVRINESGAYILEQYFRLQSETETAKMLGLQYGVSEEEALADVRGFLQSLREQGISLS